MNGPGLTSDTQRKKAQNFSTVKVCVRFDCCEKVWRKLTIISKLVLKDREGRLNRRKWPG